MAIFFICQMNSILSRKWVIHSVNLRFFEYIAVQNFIHLLEMVHSDFWQITKHGSVRFVGLYALPIYPFGESPIYVTRLTNIVNSHSIPICFKFFSYSIITFIRLRNSWWLASSESIPLVRLVPPIMFLVLTNLLTLYYLEFQDVLSFHSPSQKCANSGEKISRFRRLNFGRLNFSGYRFIRFSRSIKLDCCTNWTFMTASVCHSTLLIEFV